MVKARKSTTGQRGDLTSQIRNGIIGDLEKNAKERRQRIKDKESRGEYVSERERVIAENAATAARLLKSGRANDLMTSGAFFVLRNLTGGQRYTSASMLESQHRESKERPMDLNDRQWGDYRKSIGTLIDSGYTYKEIAAAMTFESTMFAAL